MYIYIYEIQTKISQRLKRNLDSGKSTSKNCLVTTYCSQARLIAKIRK